MIKIKRAYARSQKSDGYRILIDRLWPRGIKKSDLALGEWTKDLAPSTELRKSFAHDPAKWEGFQKDYKKELRFPEAKQKIKSLAAAAQRGPVTLIYSARDEEHNDAVVLKGLIDRQLKKKVS
jgi:uncharacterized protein YeaO (DUF488 family)